MNTFQCVLATDEKASFAILLYPKDGIQWTTGDASGGKNGFGGTPAQAGINAGDGSRCTCVFEALTDEIVNIDKSSNVKLDGIYVYRVDGSYVKSPSPCATKGQFLRNPTISFIYLHYSKEIQMKGSSLTDQSIHKTNLRVRGGSAD